MRRALRVLFHLVGFTCLCLSVFDFSIERWPSQLSLRPARVESVNPHEIEMAPLKVVDHSGRQVIVSGPWEKIQRLHPGETVWIHDYDNRDGDCTRQGTTLAGPIPIREGILLAGLLYLVWLGFLAGRRFKRIAQA